jgi:hypothetical protein
MVRRPAPRETISLDGNRAVFFSGLGRTQLYSLATGRADPETLRDGLDHLDAAGFCGPGGFIRLGTRGTESGIFFEGRETAELSSLPSTPYPSARLMATKSLFTKRAPPSAPSLSVRATTIMTTP